MAHHKEEMDGKEKRMGGKHGGKSHGMGKKEAGFGAKLGKMNMGKAKMEGPHK